MNLATLTATYGHLLDTMDVVAPVDFAYMFRDGLVERPAIREPACQLTGAAGIVTSAVDVDTLDLRAHALFVTGDVRATSLALRGNVVILGGLTATDVRGWSSPFTLTVMGKVALGRAVMEQQFLMQFLGGGRIDELIHPGGSGQALLEVMRGAGSVLAVGVVSTVLPPPG